MVTTAFWSQSPVTPFKPLVLASNGTGVGVGVGVGEELDRAAGTRRECAGLPAPASAVPKVSGWRTTAIWTAADDTP